MTESTPVSVPDELQPLAALDPAIIDVLRRNRIELELLCGLSERDIEMVRLGALIGLGAPDGSFTSHIGRARLLEVSDGEIWGAVTAVAPLVGVPRLIEVVPLVAAALQGG